ncbi:hypothetical protein C0J52_27198, partial [Blattella germanica]
MAYIKPIGIVCLLVLATVSAEGEDDTAYEDWDQYSDSYGLWNNRQGSSLDYPSFTSDRYEGENPSKYSDESGSPVVNQPNSHYPWNSYGRSFHPGWIPGWQLPPFYGSNNEDNLQPYNLERMPWWNPRIINKRNQEQHNRRPWQYRRRRKRPWWHPSDRRPSGYIRDQRSPWPQPHYKNQNNAEPRYLRRRPWWDPEYASRRPFLPYLIRKPTWRSPYYLIKIPLNYIRPKKQNRLKHHYTRKPWWIASRPTTNPQKSKLNKNIPKTIEIIEEIDYPINDMNRKKEMPKVKPKIIEIIKEVDYPWPAIPHEHVKTPKNKKPRELQIVEYIDYPSDDETTPREKPKNLVLEVIKDIDYPSEEITTTPRIIELLEEIEYPSRNGNDESLLEIEEDIDYTDKEKYKPKQKNKKTGIIEITEDIDYEENPHFWWKKQTSSTNAYTMQPYIPTQKSKLEVDIEYLWDDTNDLVTKMYRNKSRTYHPTRYTYYPWRIKKDEEMHNKTVYEEIEEVDYQDWKTSEPRTKYTTDNVRFENGEIIYPIQTKRTRNPWPFTFYPWTEPSEQYVTGETFYPHWTTKSNKPWPFTFYPWVTTSKPSTPRYITGETYYPHFTTRYPSRFTYYPWATTPESRTGETYYPRQTKPRTRNPVQFTYYPWMTTSKPATRQTTENVRLETGETFYPRQTWRTRNPWPFTFYPWTETSKQYLTGETFYPRWTTRTRRPWPFTF